MGKRLPRILILLALSSAWVRSAIPSSELYPFPGYDLDVARDKTKAESGPDSKDLSDAWRIYGAVQGSWMPGRPKPTIETVAQLDALKGRLEKLALPAWFSAAQNSPSEVHTNLAEKIGDKVFEQQKVSPEYQSLKALAIVYLSEHELDRPGSAQKAGNTLTPLVVTHPWDWQIHGLYSRFLIDAQQNFSAWNEAKLSLFLNPSPELPDLKFFAFVGSIADRQEWPAIMVAIRESVKDENLAERAIRESEILFSANSKVNMLPSK